MAAVSAKRSIKEGERAKIRQVEDGGKEGNLYSFRFTFQTSEILKTRFFFALKPFKDVYAI